AANPQGHQKQAAAGAEPARFELGEVVAGDVLHPAPATVDQAAVAGDERDAEDVVAHRAESLAQRSGRRGRYDGAERPAGETGGVEREPGAAVGELLAQQVAPNARLGGGGEV